jgi:hypothetical protein
MSSPCPICGFDGSQLSPADAAVALRSFPRRFTLVLARPDDEDRPDDVLHRRPGSGGLSAVEHAAWVATGLAQAAEAFGAIVYSSAATVTLPALDVDPPVRGGDAGPDAVVAAIKGAADPLASAIGDAPADAWTRTGLSAEGPVTALDVVRLAVHLGVHHLRQAEQAIAAAIREIGSGSA